MRYRVCVDAPRIPDRGHLRCARNITKGKRAAIETEARWDHRGTAMHVKCQRLGLDISIR